MRNNRGIHVAAIVAAGAMALAACSSGGDQSGGGSSGALDLFLNMPAGSPQEEVMKELVATFEEKEAVKVNLTTAAASYEDDMKVKMASDSMPDVISTHGWSVLRYSPFLMPLEDQPWAEYMNPSLDEVMLDSEGHLYALPLEYGTTGMLVNYDVLEAAGVDAEGIDSWDKLNEAMAAVAEKTDAVPFTSAGKDKNAGDVGNFIASGQYTQQELQQFADGTFDPQLWESGVTNHLQEWTDKGWINPDYVSATYDDMARQLAEGTAAFAMSWPFVLSDAYDFNPDVNLGFIPLPGIDGPYLVGGEGVSAFGVAKDAKNQEEALKFLEFLAEPANAKKLLEASGAYSGLTNVEVDLGNIQPSFDKYVAPGTIPTKAFFDRVYLPNGMWNTIITSTDGVFTGQMDSAAAAKQMEEQFKTLYGQQG
ncbi:extracellular solute-binding protein [Actinomycetaceae bacterium WB03_NA08]|uniref:Extracellular solute-binding protein n=1 Tax=Scrofimicrobium canadense TaxID=2652290 RepID=A0A6N7W5G0_9ACTO|nr:extracellular solute-binding protein [Scrofimicrobium canadense]MSS84641.1 extracellular solute-binding protein [Scrofimicrobium canadense]